ncbi:MAG: hypothetical protein KGI98_13945, partial [Euryarchaeota archaeon]|nr:hypothetical protein [Euryarchaeota archaeon]
GFYDHVAPPSLDGVQQGERVPLIVVSPYAKEDYVSHTVMNHASWLAFVDYNWGLPALNAFVADSSLPLDLFDLGNSPRAPYPFSASEGFPAPTALHFELPANPVLAPLFPRALQENPSSLPYGRTGSSTTTLSSLGTTLFVSQDQPFTPWYLDSPFLLTVLVAEGLSWAVLPRVEHRSRRSPA